MKTIRRIFSITMVACVALLQIAPALPAYAVASGKLNEEVKVERLFDKDNLPAEKQQVADWSQTDWDSEVVLLPDMEKYQQELGKIAEAGKSGEAKNLQPKRVRMNSDEALEYYHVPGEVKEVVKQYRDNTGLFAKKDSNNKDLLKSYIQSLLPLESLLTTPEISDNPVEHFVDIKTAPKLNIKKIKAESSVVKPVEYKITDTKFKIKKHPLQNVTIKGISEQVKQRGLSGKKLSAETGLFDKLKGFVSNLFNIEPVNAETATDLIAYYNGIENNTLDNALYYISQSQTASSSFFQITQYEETAETSLALADIGRTASTQFLDSLNYLINTEPQNNREKAIKARLMVGLGEPYQVYLDEFIAEENSDHGYGLDVGYESDILTTMEGALAMYTANYSIQDKLPLALYYVLNHIPDNGALKYESNGPVSYYLINKIAQYLQPFRSMTVGNDQGVNISVQSKINALLGYLSSQYDDANQKLLGTTDIIDEMMTLETWKMYGVEQARQKVLETNLNEKQYVDGSFGNSLRATTYSLETLDKPDLVLTNLQSTGVLQSRQSATFSLTIENKGYSPATDAVIYIFPDNVYTGLSLNLGAAGITIEPNETVNINFTIPASETNKYTGEVSLKLYIEPSTDVNFDDNWLYSTFNFAPAVDGTPALPMYYAVFKYSLNGNPAVIATIPSVQKTDPNRSGYALLFKEHSATSWQWTNYSPSGYIIGYFPEGAYYDFTMGVINAAGTDITYFSDITTVHLSANDSLYTGSASGRITLDNQNMPNTYAFIQAGFSTTTDVNGQFFKSGGHNGRIAAWVDKSQYEQIRETFNVQEGQTTQNVRIFTHLKADTQAPILTKTELRWATTYKVKNQTEYSLFSFGSDNVAIKEGDFYLWNPVEQIWTFLGTALVENSSYATLKWYVPADLPLTTGYKIKGILRDYRGNESEAKEWGSFEIIDGTVPTFSVVTPNGGEEWSLNTTNTISWNTTSTGGVSKVNLYYEYPNSYNSIKSSVNNIGSYDWYIPYNSSYVGNQFKIRVAGNDSVNFLSGLDNSDNYFTIKDSSPKPADPWSMPGYLSAPSTTSQSINFDNYQVAYDQQGVAHVVYHYTEDSISTNPRTMTERLYYTKFQDNSWTEPQVVYEKIWQTDSSLNGYLPIGDLKLELVGSNPNLVWRSMGGSGGCISFNNQEIYHYYFNGSSWVGPTNMSNNATGSDSPDLIADTSGNLTMVWGDGRTYDENCASTGTRKLLYSTKNAGGNWGTVNLFSGVQYPSYSKLAVTTGNKVNLVVLDGLENAIKHYVLSGGNWTNVKTVPGTNIYYPTLRSYNDKLYYAYTNYYNDPQLGGRSRIMYTYFDGSAWQPVTEVSPIVANTNNDYPSLAIDGQGNPQMVFHYQDNNNNISSLVWTTKLKNDAWLAPQVVSLGSQYVYSNQAAFAGRGNNLLAVWGTYYSFSPRLAFNTADVGIDYIAPQPVTGFTGQSATNSIKLSWDKYANIDNDFDHFEIWRGEQPVGGGDYSMVSSIYDANINSYIDNGDQLYLGDRYYVIQVHDTAGHITASENIGPIKINLVLYPLLEVRLDGAGTDMETNYNLGSMKVGEEKNVDLKLANRGYGELIIQPFEIDDNSLCSIVYTPEMLNIQPEASSSFSIKYKPINTTSTTCSIIIHHNDNVDAENPFIIHLSAEVLPANVVSFLMHLNENVGSTQFVDSSGNNVNGMCVGSACPLAGVPGVSSTALRFDGANDVISANNSENLEPDQALTLETWVKPYPSSNYYGVVVNKGLNYELTITNSGGLRAGITNIAGTRVVLDIPKVITMYQWNHLALTYDGAMIRVYVNGVKVGEKAQTGAVKNDVSALLIGNFNNTYPFFGTIDEIKFYKQALTDVEVATEYNISIPSSFDGSLKYQFNETVSSTQFFDLNSLFPLTCLSAQCPIAGVPGVSSTALRFDGINDVVTANDSEYFEPDQFMTLETWIKPQPTSNYYAVVAVKGLNYELTITNNGGLRVGITNTAGTRVILDMPSVIKMYEWNHLALTYNGSMIRAYVNGVKVGEKAQTGAVKNDNSALLIGNYNNSYPFFGTIDELKFYKQPLTDVEIATEYNNSKPVPVIVNSLFYQLNEPVNSTQFFDLNSLFPLTCLSAQCPVAGMSGVSSTALQFDGNNDVISANDSEYIEPGQNLTLETWVKPQPSSKYYAVVVTKGLNYELTITNSGGLRAGITNTAGTRVVFDMPSVIKINEWNHLAMTYDGALIRAYVNGVKVGESAQTGAIKNDTSPLQIGSFNSSYPFLGTVDEIRFYKQVLTDGQILAEYNSSKPI